MIVGTAKIEISAETLVLALQEYFDRRLADGSRMIVTDVDKPNQYEKRFVVQVRDEHTNP